MSGMTRERAAAQAIADQDRRRLNTFHEAQARDALAAADAHDTANGVHRVSLDEATVGRAMNALYEHREDGLTCYDHAPTSTEKVWCCACGEHSITMSHRQHMARAVLAAAVKEGTQ